MWFRAAIAAFAIALPSSALAQDNYHWPRQHAAPPLSQTVPDALAAPLSPVDSPRGAEHTTGELTDDDIVGGYEHDGTGFEARISLDGRVSFRDKLPISGDGFVTPIFAMAFGAFDVTDVAMRAAGQDPYQYHKARFLEQTFEARARLRMSHDRAVMARALRTLPDYLEAVWDYQAWDPNLRKRVLFALWDECAERGNDFIIRGGAEARAVIERYIRAELPAGGPHGFTDAEIAALNRIRSSKARFAPYE